MAVNAYLQKEAVEQSHDHRQQALELELARLDQPDSTRGVRCMKRFFSNVLPTVSGRPAKTCGARS